MVDWYDERDGLVQILPTPSVPQEAWDALKEAESQPAATHKFGACRDGRDPDLCQECEEAARRARFGLDTATVKSQRDLFKWRWSVEWRWEPMRDDILPWYVLTIDCNTEQEATRLANRQRQVHPDKEWRVRPIDNAGLAPRS